MRFGPLDHPFTGVAVPVWGLRSGASCGTGEYADLALLAPWCSACGLEIVQLLPVNDTGSNSSPYSALSAFALHPLYLRLQEVPGAERYAAEIRSYREQAEARPRLDYAGTLAFKLSILERVFADRRAEVESEEDFASWREANPWAEAYAAFRALEQERGGAGWWTWPESRRSAAAGAAVRAAWREHTDACLFFAWLQFLAERQLADAARLLERADVRLKGDLPILMSEQSADVWAEGRFFDRSMRAGAPPDMYSPDGQHWGFPVYDWGALAADGYRWWRSRIAQAAKFFSAFRIDHVLGFFRIWRIPRGESSGLLGGFDPYEAITPADLAAAGCDEGRLRWLSLPHIPGAALRSALGADAERVARLHLSRVGDEDLYNFRPGLDDEEAIRALGEPEPVKRFLLERHRDRALLARPDGTFHPSWLYERSSPFSALVDDDRRRLSALFRERRARSEITWQRRGRELLTMAREASDMLVCAEDLGDVPDCVPRVLADLGILGLRVDRWARRWKEPGSPFIAPAEHPRLTVCTPSVHDTSTLRGWWEESAEEREAYWPLLGLAGPCPPTLHPQAHEAIIRRNLGAASAICMLQIQELLDLDADLRSADPRDDRINVPGTIADTNWSWRMPAAVERVTDRAELTSRIRGLVDGRRAGRSR